MSEAAMKSVEGSVSLIRAAADTEGIKLSMKALNQTVLEHADTLISSSQFQGLLSVFGEAVKRSFTDLTEESIDSAFEVFDAAFEAAATLIETIVIPQTEDVPAQQQQQQPASSSSSWIMRGLLMKQLNNDFVNSALAPAMKIRPEQVKERGHALIKTLLSVAFYDNTKDLKLQRNAQELRIALDMTVKTCFDLPNATLAVLTSTVNGIVDDARSSNHHVGEAQDQRIKSIISTIQDLVGMTMTRTTNSTSSMSSLIFSSLQTSVSSLILPHNDWEKGIDLGAWSTAAAMADKNAYTKNAQTSWTNSIIERFLQDAESFLNAEEKPQQQQEDDAEAAVATASTTTKPKGKKAGGKKAAPKKPAGKKGKKAAKVEEEEEDQDQQQDHDNEQEDEHQKQEKNNTPNKSSYTPSQKQNLVFKRAMMLLETFSQASTRNLKLSNVCKLGDIILRRLVDQLEPATADFAEEPMERRIAHAKMSIWRMLLDLIKNAVVVVGSAASATKNSNDDNALESSSNNTTDEKNVIQSFLNTVLFPSIRAAIPVSCLLVEILLVAAAEIRHIASRAFPNKEDIVLILENSSTTTAAEADADAAAAAPVAAEINQEGPLSSGELQQLTSRMTEIKNVCESQASVSKRVMWVLRNEAKKAKTRRDRVAAGLGAEDDDEGEDDQQKQQANGKNDNNKSGAQENGAASTKDEDGNDNQDDVVDDEELAAEEGLVDEYSVLLRNVKQLSNAIDEIYIRCSIATIIQRLCGLLIAAHNSPSTALSFPKTTWQLSKFQLQQISDPSRVNAGSNNNNNRGGGGRNNYSNNNNNRGYNNNNSHRGGGGRFDDRGRRGPERYGGNPHPRR